MKKIQAIAGFCTLLLALGAWAVQTSAPSQPQSGQPQSTQPPSQPPSAQPQEGGQPGQQPPPPQGQTAPQGSSIDEQVKALSVELNLTADQQPKLKAILEDQRNQGLSIVNDKASTREDKVQKLHALRESTISKVREMLNDDQKKKLDQMLQEPDQGPKDQSGGPPK
ncbi:MAG TPA: hypothetical protein VIX19_17675 [Terriglobales bacterium]